LVSPSFLKSADWPKWLGPTGDSVYHEQGVITAIPDGGLVTLWEYEVGLGYTGPAVANGKVYLMDYIRKTGEITNNAGAADQISGVERILCLNAETGRLIWKYDYECPYNMSYPSGPRCTPTVVDGKVYALGAEGNLTCLDADSGRLIWSKHFRAEYGAETPIWGHSAHPMVHKDTLYCIVGGEGSVVVAFNKDTGKELWRGLSAAKQGYCPPSIIHHGGKEQLIVWHPESVNSLNPQTGDLYWSEALNPDWGGSIQIPRKLGSQLFVGGPQVAALFLLKSVGGTPAVETVWQGNPRNAVYPVNSAPIFTKDAIYGVDNGSSSLMAIKVEDGSRLWETNEPVVNDTVRRTRQGTAFLIRHRDTNLYYLLNESGDFIIAEISPQGYDEIGRVHVIEPTNSTNAGGARKVVWSHPAFAQKTMFARNDNKMIAIDLNKDNY